MMRVECKFLSIDLIPIILLVECVYHGERATDGRFSPVAVNGLFATTGRDRQIAIWQCLPGAPMASAPQPLLVCSVCTGHLYLIVPQTLHTSTVPECVQMDRLETVVAFGTVTGTVKVFSLEQEKRK